jgi:hypothetical protein
MIAKLLRINSGSGPVEPQPEPEAVIPKPRLPRFVRVADRIYTIEVWDKAAAEEANCYGTCSPVQKLILIDVSVSDYTTASVLIHEILHAIHSEYNVKGIDDEERVVRCVGRGLMQVFLDNPRLLDYFAETMTAARLALKSQEL